MVEQNLILRHLNSASFLVLYAHIRSESRTENDFVKARPVDLCKVYGLDF